MTNRIAVLTSGGDAPGMNAAVRAVVRTGISMGAEVYAVFEGYRGMIDGGDRIRPISWTDVGGILHQGGTVIGSARCPEFRERPGRLRAAQNLLQAEVSRLVIIGGDGSLSGATIFQEEWPSLVAELVDSGAVSADVASRHPHLMVAGLPGSIDNDLSCTDMTIGADTALHRITAALDSITSTAASHQRSFVVEVMGRKCGYLALMGAMASAADWVLIPESPPNLDEWESKMCSVLAHGRSIGRRDSIVVVAEGACDRNGNPISSDYVKKVLEERLQEDTRVTILGHVQRGGAPSAFDRNLSTLLGTDAVTYLLTAAPDSPATFIGIHGNKITRTLLAECLAKTRAVTTAVRAKDFEKAMELRGSSFKRAFRDLRTMVRAVPHAPKPDHQSLRIAVMTAGGPAPGMNTAVRAATRLGIDRGHELLRVDHGFDGLINDEISDLGWMSVNGWAHVGGAEMGTSRHIPAGSDFYAIARNIEKYQIEALLVIGGTDAYKAAVTLCEQRPNFPTFNIPIICLPATIDNDLPGAELSVGADTALNNIVEAVDKIKQSAVANRRVYVVEVMGRYCGYLAVMSAMATGAERVYIHEEGITMNDLVADVRQLIQGFSRGKRLGVIIRNEYANGTYSTNFITALLTEEGRREFDVRQAILGHLQQGGNPTPFDRIQASRMASECITYLESQLYADEPESACIGLVDGNYRFTNLMDISRLMDKEYDRPKTQWWLSLRPIARVMAQPAPKGDQPPASTL